MYLSMRATISLSFQDLLIIFDRLSQPLGTAISERPVCVSPVASPCLRPRTVLAPRLIASGRREEVKNNLSKVADLPDVPFTYLPSLIMAMIIIVCFVIQRSV
jgi:hypothetical protein